jgi:magnesium transporter
MVVDVACYVNGTRDGAELGFGDALIRARSNGGFVWVGLFEPTAPEFTALADAFQLHPLAVEDAVHAHQRPKMEPYGDMLFVVLKPARYVDHEEVITVGQIMAFVGPDYIVTVRHGDVTELGTLRARLESDPSSLEWGPSSVLYAISDLVVDDYGVVLRKLNEEIDEVESNVFSEPRAAHAKQIFKLKRETLDFRRAVDPLETPMSQLAGSPRPIDARSSAYFRDVHDHVLRISDQLHSLDALLDSALHANVAQVGMRQNEDMRKISAWVAIIAVPTMIAGLYGMNFDHMPELHWRFGYPLVVGTMVVLCLLLYRNFKKRQWL